MMWIQLILITTMHFSKDKMILIKIKVNSIFNLGIEIRIKYYLTLWCLWVSLKGSMQIHECSMHVSFAFLQILIKQQLKIL